MRYVHESSHDYWRNTARHPVYCTHARYEYTRDVILFLQDDVLATRAGNDDDDDDDEF